MIREGRQLVGLYLGKHTISHISPRWLNNRDTSLFLDVQHSGSVLTQATRLVDVCRRLPNKLYSFLLGGGAGVAPGHV